MELEAPRARRRRLTETVALHHHSDHVRALSPPWWWKNGEPGRRHSFTPSRWDKNRPLCCGCSKARRGSPRRCRGMCDRGARDRVYRWRTEARLLNQMVLRGEELDSDAFSLLAGVRCMKGVPE